jgi:exopolyphosphatase/guanosine-5'-triphosphate,3'-diphosphate pyrophosphatase
MVHRPWSMDNMNRIAILDLGTNTFHLLIADIELGKEPSVIAKESASVKLGEGGITNATITDAAFTRGINTLHHFNRIIKANSVDEIRAAGTAALRVAKNGSEFINRAFKETGIAIKIIDGDKEAELIYEGVRHAVKLAEDPVLIVDIGGGSVEFILCNNHHIYWKESYPIGAAKLMALFHHNDPISQDEINTIYEFLDEQLSALKTICGKFKPGLLIGSAGAFETFAELEVLQYKLDPALIRQTEFSFDIKHFQVIATELLKTTHAQREIMPGLAEIRIDMIIVATILTRYILKELDISEMKLSAYSLKEGLLFQT